MFFPAHVVQAQSSRRTTDTTFAVDRGVALNVNSTSANITIRGWNRNDIHISAGASAGVSVSGSSRTVHVEAGVSVRQRNDDAAIEIQVPRGTRVSAGSRNGDVRVTDVGGVVDADVVSGDVTISGSVDRANVSIAAGEVHVTDADGRVHVDAISGDVTLVNVRGDVEVTATSSDVSMRGIRSSHVTAQLVSGSISFDGAIADNGRYEFNSHSGDVRMYLADKARGSLELQTFSGDVHTSIPLVTSGSAPRASLQGNSSRGSALRGPQHFEFGGGGGAQIVISTFSGDVHIDRGPRRGN